MKKHVLAADVLALVIVKIAMNAQLVGGIKLPNFKFQNLFNSYSVNITNLLKLI